MLKRIIATAMCFALLANTSMITSAADSVAENSVVVDGTERSSESETKAIATEESSVEETTSPTEAESPADVGKTIRRSLNAAVMDIVIFDDVQVLYDAEWNEEYADCGWNMWIIGVDDENQRFRVQVPEITPTGEKVLYLTYQDAKNAVVISHDGHVKGDLDFDGVVDVFDMCLMRRGFIYGWDITTRKIMADMNDDGEVTIADLIWLQKWLLGVIK